MHLRDKGSYSPQPVDGRDGEGECRGQNPDEEDGNTHHPQHLRLASLQHTRGKNTMHISHSGERMALRRHFKQRKSNKTKPFRSQVKKSMMQYTRNNMQDSHSAGK